MRVRRFTTSPMSPFGESIWQGLRRVLLCSLLVSYIGYSRSATEFPEASPDTVSISYLDVFNQIIDLAINPAQVAAVKNFSFRRDVATFYLEEGDLYLCQPVEGRVCAALFLGRGKFSFTPPTRIEQDHLYRFYETRTMNEKFKVLFLVFADTTLAELQTHLTFKEGKVSRQVKGQLDYVLKYISNKKGKQVDYMIMKTLLDEAHNGLFYAHFSWDKIKPMFFQINPFAIEEVSFMRRLKGPSYLYTRETVNQFHTREDYASGNHLKDENKYCLNIHNYRSDCTLQGSQLKFSAETELEFTALKAPQNWFDLWIYDELEVDSVFWDTGKKADYIKEKNNPILWIKGDHPLQENETRKLKIHYHGDLIDRKKDWFYIKSSKGWYPRHADQEKAKFDLTFHVPKDFQFACIGKLLSWEIEEDMVTSHWITPQQIRNASFNIGFFKEHQIDADSIPSVTIYMAETGHREIAQSMARAGWGSDTNMEKRVGEDVARSIAFFQDVFGKAPVEHFYATEIPYLHGEAFSGLIHLSWLTFHRTAEGGGDEAFRAHEVAHQWWGIGVDMKSYHDQWISEGFSEYAGWLYLKEAFRREGKDNQKFFEFLEKWRKEIVGVRKSWFGEGQKPAPIWLGYRTHSSDTRGDYSLIIYKKGAWVLHMLRNLFRDLETMDDSRFKSLMRGFYESYYGGRASTEDFLEFLESNSGEELDWFFDQWVYGSDIPDYTFSYQIEASATDQYRLRCRVKQSGVPTDFQMPVILGIDFGNDEIVARRIWVKGTASEFDLGEFSRKPQDVIFNHLESVLCEFTEEDWKEANP